MADRASTSAARKPKQRVHSKTRFSQDWTKKHPCIVEDLSKNGNVICKLCSKSFCITHQGYRDIERHLSSSLHRKIAREMVLQPRITDSFSSISESSAGKVTAAEVKFTAFLLEHNLPIAVADHAGPLFRSMFPDSKIAQSYHCARTKATCIVNGALAVECADQVISKARSQPFTLCLDGSNDQESHKLIPLQ